ncbi:hypothetical protein XELAEV_18012902mg [Xenopus laevis]|uniref:CCHC-type domain-containing protein n=1 Tax=Xenopus laevis TaxID=8355 RepID=A0A974DR57_XENLA|nr:hypothetical protein XELAEV_18012902mg [Xenopus laevis]
MCNESMSSFETPQSVRQWCTALLLNPRKVAAVGPMEVDAYVRVKRSSTSGHADISSADAKLLEENKKLHKELEELKAQLSERVRTPTETKKFPKCYWCVFRKCRRYFGRCYKCQVVGHQARSCKTYKSSTVQKYYYKPIINESDSPKEDRVLTTVENPVDMKVAPETSDTPDRSKRLGLGKRRSPGKANFRVSGNSSDTEIIDCCFSCMPGDKTQLYPVLPLTSLSPVTCRGVTEWLEALEAVWE